MQDSGLASLCLPSPSPQRLSQRDEASDSGQLEAPLILLMEILGRFR